MFTRNGDRASYQTRSQRQRQKLFASLFYYGAVVFVAVAFLLAVKAAFDVYTSNVTASSLQLMGALTSAPLTWLSWCFVSLLAVGFALLAWHFKKKHAVGLVIVSAFVLLLDTSSLLAVVRTQAFDNDMLQKITRSTVPESAGLRATTLMAASGIPVGSVIIPVSNNSVSQRIVDGVSANASESMPPLNSTNALRLDNGSGRAPREQEVSQEMAAPAVAPVDTPAIRVGVSTDVAQASADDIIEPVAVVNNALPDVATNAKHDDTLIIAELALPQTNIVVAEAEDQYTETPVGDQQSTDTPSVLTEIPEQREFKLSESSPVVTNTPPAPTVMAMTASADSTTGSGYEHLADWLQDASPNDFTLQLFVAESEALAVAFIQRHQLSEASYFQQRKNGRVYFKVVLGRYTSQSLAQEAIKTFPSSLDSVTPWVRRLASVQQEASPSS